MKYCITDEKNFSPKWREIDEKEINSLIKRELSKRNENYQNPRIKVCNRNLIKITFNKSGYVEGEYILIKGDIISLGLIFKV